MEPRGDVAPPPFSSKPFSFISRPLEPLYRLGLGLDRRRQLKLPPHRLRVPVVSVGNLTVGGTGKTPVVEALARAWLRRGGSPGILSRGYRGGKNGNDEYRLLARRLAGVPHVAEKERRLGGERLLTENPGVDLILLDDGFQHRRLHRDLDLVLIDATRPFGGGHCLPAGWLREPWTALSRADAILITRSDQISTGALRQLTQLLRERFPHVWIGTSRLVFEGVRERGEGGKLGSVKQKAAGVVGAFCAIGNPDAFFDSLRRLGFELSFRKTFRDHHSYDERDLTELRTAARSAGVERLLTTEKDGVKLEELASFGSGSPTIGQVRMRSEFPADDLLDRVARSSPVE